MIAVSKTCMHCGQTLSPVDAEYLGHTCNDCEWAAHMDFEVRETQTQEMITDECNK